MTLAELRARLVEIETERRAIHEAAADAALNDEQQARWDALDVEENGQGEDAGLREQIRIAEETESRAARVAESRRRWGSTQISPNVAPETTADVRSLPVREVRDRALALLDDGEATGHLSDEQRTHMDRLLRKRDRNLDGGVIARLALATDNEHYRSAFQKIAASQTPILTAEEGRAVNQVNEIRAASIGTDGAGGFAVPVMIDPTIILTAQGSPNDILRLARVEIITNDEWKGVSSAGVTWKFDAEAAAATDNAPTIAQPSVTTRRADGFIPFSIEVGMDWPGFAESMSMLLGEGYDELLAEKLTTGTSGSNEPIGLITRLDGTAAIELEVATAGTIAAGDVYRLWNALPQRFRRGANCAWMSSTDVQNSIRQLGTVDPNFTINLTEEAIPRMFGRQYPLNDFMQDDPVGTGTQPLLVVGDFRHYLVAQRAGMTVEFIPHLFDVTNNRPTGQRGWFAWARVGADTTTTNAFRLLVNRSA